MEARKVTFTAKPGTFRDAVRAYKKYKEEKEQRLERKLQQLEEEIQKAKYTAALGPKGRFLALRGCSGASRRSLQRTDPLFI